ncbi:MAG: transporter substrate-binding domain-containing protein [Legionella sp.]|nr:transporter substrate-binding domain-containing protein [Legionella sp.]
MRQIKGLLVLVFCFLFSIAGHSTINIGTLPYDPPYIISPHEGFDIDLSRMLCQRLKEQCNIIPMGAKQIYQELKNGKIDIAIAGITISPELQKEFIFSLPYMFSQGQFLTLKGSSINSINDLNGTTVGVIIDSLSGRVFYNYLIKNHPDQFRIKSYESVENMFAALSNKTIAAVFLYRSDVNYWNHNGGNMFKPLGPVVTLGEGLAIMALPEKQELIEKINGVLDEMEQDDTYLDLYKTYFSNQ